MRAIMIMFDSLRKNMLPPYGCEAIHAPNFKRLEEKCLTFDNFFVGSLPCMPARREFHTGRYGFLHRGWSPLEPFDDSMPELLDQNGIHTHLVSDHFHYWNDGGANYHARYSTYQPVRGQEGDKWGYDIRKLRAPLENPTTMRELPPGVPELFKKMFQRDSVNRDRMDTFETHPNSLTFAGGLDFLQTNKDQQDWYLQVECYDPHEPFYTFQEFRDMYPSSYQGRHIDWPSASQVQEDPALIEYVRNQYKAVVTMCDRNLGKVLDFMDANDMWKDTMLIVNADHGLLLGEHQWWGKGAMPVFNEIANTPFFLWDPRCGKKGEHRQSIAQTIDLAPTLLDFFGVDIPADMEGKPLKNIAQSDEKIRDYALYGYFGGHVNITDGRYVYMRGPANESNLPLNEYVINSGSIFGRASVNMLKDAELAPPFPHTKGLRTWKLDQSKGHPHFNPAKFGTLLFDLEQDPTQDTVINDPDVEARMVENMIRLMQANGAPEDQYERLGLKPE
ncbi:sulfatase [Ruminococcaceae bacterium OttesenSCG-928-L11]|nr:sulfatase [Ruminococcaceae bacterium OttesenSCG-928-L11]